MTEGENENTSCSGATYCCPNSGGVSDHLLYLKDIRVIRLTDFSLAMLCKSILLGTRRIGSLISIRANHLV